MLLADFYQLAKRMSGLGARTINNLLIYAVPAIVLGSILRILTQTSIGQHVRHIIEFYQCLLHAEHRKEVNYDERQRNLKLETDIDFAAETIKGLVNTLSKVKQDFPITYVADYSTSDDEVPLSIQTTFYRELVYNLEHSIHHTLIKVAITEMNLTTLIAENFGYAPSTIRQKTTPG